MLQDNAGEFRLQEERGGGGEAQNGRDGGGLESGNRTRMLQVAGGKLYGWVWFA